jgi:hypothetical protein
MSHDDTSTGFDRGARWMIAAVNEAVQNGKVLPNQLAEVLVELENMMNDWGAEPLMHQQHKLVARAIDAVHNREFEPLD